MKLYCLLLLLNINLDLVCKQIFKIIIYSYEDSDSSEDEGMPDYKIGGYHSMHVGYDFFFNTNSFY